MEKVPRRDICVENYAINVYNPAELLTQTIQNLPVSNFSRFYTVEDIKLNKNCSTGQSYRILFLEDITTTLPLNAENYRLVKQYFPLVSKAYILSAWAQDFKVKDDWNSLKKENIIYAHEDRNDFKTEIPLIPKNDTWVDAKTKLYQNQPFEVDMFNISSLEMEIMLESQSARNLDILQVFNGMHASQRLPYIYCKGNVKKDTTTVYSNLQDISIFWCALAIHPLPVVMPKKEIIFQIENDWGTIELIMKPGDWINRSTDDIKNFMTSNNIPQENVEILIKEIDIWKDYMSTFSDIILDIDKKFVKVRAKLNPDSDVTSEFANYIITKLFGTTYNLKNVRPGAVNVTFRYPNIAVDSNILFYIIKNNPVLCHLLLPMEDKKVVVISHDKNKYKGSFRLLAKVYDETIKTNITQNSGNKRSDGNPFLSVSINSAKNIYTVYEFARLFGIALQLYVDEKQKIAKLFKKYIPKYPNPPKIKYTKKDCKTDKDCSKTSCNPVNKKCSPNISTTVWWAENYSRKCQPVIPWIVDPSTVDELRTLGFHVEEFPKNSGEFLTCPKSMKGRKVYDNFYLISNSSNNQKKFPFLPCCGAEDRRSQAGALFNKYYGNLENLDLNNGTNLEINFETFSKGSLNTLLKFAEDKLTIIGFDPSENKFLAAKDINITPTQAEIIEDIPQEPIGALLITQKKKKIVATIFTEKDIIEAEKIVYYSRDEEEFDPLTIGLTNLINSLDNITIKFHLDSLKRNEDLNTQKRASIGRKGILPRNIDRILKLISLRYNTDTVWKRRGITRDSSASFLHVLNCVKEKSTISRDSSFAVRKKFLDASENIGKDKATALCKQSMFDLSIEEIWNKIDPNSEEYINPRQFHALAETIFEMNIILIQRSIDSDLGEFVLPYYNEVYLTSSNRYDQTVLVYEHFGTDAEKFLKTPHCEIVEGELTDEIANYLFRIWLYNVKFFNGTELIVPIKVPSVFLEDGWSQIINDAGHGIKLVKDEIVLNTILLPPLPIPETKNISTNATETSIEEFALDQEFEILSLIDKSNFVEIQGNVKGESFPFQIISWKNDHSDLRVYLENRKNAKCLIGYFNYALARYLTNIDFNEKNLYKQLKQYSPDTDQTSLSDCIYTDLIENFVQKHVSTDKWNTILKFSEMLPPPRNIYRNKILYINNPLVAKTTEDITTILFRLKLQAKLFMKYKLNLLLSYYNSQSIPKFFEQKEDFKIVANEILTTPKNNYFIDNRNNVYNHPLVNEGIDYIWKHHILTKNKTCISRTFSGPQAQHNIQIWLTKFDLNFESINTVNIDTTFEPSDVDILSPRDPIIFIVQVRTLYLAIPVIEYNN